MSTETHPWYAANLPIDLRDVTPVSADQLCLAHDHNFVRSVLSGAIPNGFGITDMDVAQSLLFTNGAMLCAARCALESGIACAPVSGFHHASHAEASLFCTFNGLMVTAATLSMVRCGCCFPPKALGTSSLFLRQLAKAFPHQGMLLRVVQIRTRG
ncbi:MAG: hypothetical protein ABI859_02860 [Pseudomonadota bacterium]